MAELKPCPFCGGEVELVHDADMENYVIECENHGWDSLCKTPDMVAGDILMVSYRDTDESKRALIEAWNTRWERTCHDDGTTVFRCDACGAFAQRSAVMDCCATIPIRYCPNCGAKVVGK